MWIEVVFVFYLEMNCEILMLLLTKDSAFRELHTIQHKGGVKFANEGKVLEVSNISKVAENQRLPKGLPYHHIQHAMVNGNWNSKIVKQFLVHQYSFNVIS